MLLLQLLVWAGHSILNHLTDRKQHFPLPPQVLITAEQTVDVGGVVSVVKRWLRSEVSNGHCTCCS